MLHFYSECRKVAEKGRYSGRGRESTSEHPPPGLNANLRIRVVDGLVLALPDEGGVVFQDELDAESLSLTRSPPSLEFVQDDTEVAA